MRDTAGDWMSSWGHDRLASPGEVALASRVSGVLWLSGAVTLLLTLALPGATIDSLWVVAVTRRVRGGVGRADALARSRGRTRPVRLSHVSTILSLGIVAALTRVTGGADSPALDYLWFIVVYAAFFYPPRQALAYWLACGVVHALPFLYDGHATERNLARQLVVVVPIYCLVGGVVVAGRELLAGATRRASELEAHQRRMTEEQSSLRRVATAVAAGSPADRRSSRSSRSTPGACWAPTAPPSSASRTPTASPSSGAGRTTSTAPSEPATRQSTCLPGSLLDRLRCGEAIARDELDGEHALRAPGRPGAHGRRGVGRARRRGQRPAASSRPEPRSACRTTPTSSPPPWPTPRTARGSTPRRRPTGSPACPTTAPSASA